MPRVGGGHLRTLSILAVAVVLTSCAGGSADDAGSPRPTPTPCRQLIPDCRAKRSIDITLTEGETTGALGSVDGMDLSGIISFDDALLRAAAEDGHLDAESVQVTLGSADADEHHWGHGTNLYYAIHWGGVCIIGHGGLQISGATSSPPPCGATDWGTVIDAHSGAFIVGGT